jgi:hypothetical protein
MNPRTFTRELALTMLARDGKAAIWNLHEVATAVYRQGHKSVAATLIEVADFAEREWLSRGQPLAG